ncbi:MAG: DUF4382 domain-containing protein, partial [Gammaproteobacteria bacterium]|nr:DUF4382 domain-containing protein [Gammaproteobacteria bacterium]
MAQRSSAAFTALFSLLVLAAGCSSRTEVSLTGNTPPQFSHVWLTVKEVRFHTSSTAAVTDSGWSTFTLKTPVTLDLAANTGGTLGALATSLKLLPGTYAQLRLLPLDPSAPLASSAQSAGALYNAEADYVDTAGSTHQLPLELLNPDQGIGVHASLRVPVGKLGSTLAGGVPGAAAPGTSSATSSIGTTGANNGTTTTTGTTTAATTTASTTTTTTFAVDLDATRDLVPFSTAAGVTAVLLSAHPSAYRSDGVGSIQGTLTLTNLTGISASSGVVDLQVSAETLNADGTR